jgi:predicted TIM-barrel fold metal-dependent hydrolase
MPQPAIRVREEGVGRKRGYFIEICGGKTMKIDVHNHIGVDPAYEEDRTGDELVEEMEETGVDKCVVFPFTTNPDIKEQSVIVKDALKKYPDRLIGFFTMNPKLPEMTDLMYEYKKQGFKGVVTDPRFGVTHEEKRFHELVECALVLEIPVWLHSDDKDTMRVYISPLESMLDKYPNVNFILSSMYYDAVGIATRHTNVYIDTATFWSGTYTASATKPIGTHRILMGSNTPYGLLKREVDKLKVLLELTEFQKSLIFGHNAKRLLKL